MVFYINQCLQPICNGAIGLQWMFLIIYGVSFGFGTKLFFTFEILKLIEIWMKNYFQQFQHLDTSLALLLLASITGMSTLFLYCYFGTLSTQSFLNMTHALYESNWQDLPVDLQKYVIISLAEMQKPIHYNGLGICNLSLETFSMVRATENTHTI